MLLWSVYIDSDVYECPTRWKKNIGQMKSVCLHNEMDARERHSLNRYDICD